MTRLLSALAWGVFCACSWTWCIGMYLPALMVERYGAWGFVVFAVPNVIGCALLGYVVRSAESSRLMVARHGGAMATFSLVTIAFHMYFLAWAFEALVPLAHVPSALVAAAVLAAGVAAARLGDVAWIGGAVVVYALSLLAFGTLLAGEQVTVVVSEPSRAVADVVWLAPVITAGFLCSPYLDATFHRARQGTVTPHAFAVFGLAFGVMIVFTLFIWLRGAPLPGLVMAHLLAQSTFTVGAHARELRELPATRCPTRRNAWLLVCLGAALLYPMLSPWIDRPALGSELYLRFLVAYGLLAPIYVLMFVGPRPIARTSTALKACAIVIVGCLPLYELAFVGTAAWAVVPAALVAILWLARPARPT